jgi:hypothetical protein
MSKGGLFVMRGFLVRDSLSIRRELYWLRLALLSSILLLTGCPATEQNGETPLVKVLSDFVFMGSGPYEVGKVPAHEMNSLPMPSQFKAGYQYVFHHKKLEQNADLYQNLLTKLQAEDFQITSANNNTYRYVGGPVFRINFHGNGLRGFIFNMLDGQILNGEGLVREWSIDDYVLVLEEIQQ